MSSNLNCHGRCLGADVAEAERTGCVAVTAIADVVDVADNADGVQFHIIFGGLV